MSSPAKPSVSFIVFALNEESRIEATVGTILKAVGEVNLADFQIVLADDGSTDQTGVIMERLAAENSKVNVVHNATNLGQGGAYKHGLTVARCDYVMAIAGDNAASVDSIRSTIEHVGEADIVVPYANNPKARRPIRRIGSRGFSMLLNVLFGFKIPYYNGCVFRRTLISTVTVRSNGYAFLAEIAVKLLKTGATYVAVGVRYPDGANDYSSALRLKNLKEVFRDVVRLVCDVNRMGKSPARAASNIFPS